jgi:hypothetical protein
VAAGERLLAWAPVAGGGWVAGTRDALYLPTTRLAWEHVEAADWDRELGRLRISEVGSWGEARVEHELTLDPDAAADADRLLQLLRERVTASVLLVRHVPIQGRRGVRVVARRAPSGRSEVHWVYQYDAGIDPADPFVQTAAADALAEARADVGLA